MSREGITNQPGGPSSPAPPIQPVSFDEDAPPRRPPLSPWTRKNIFLLFSVALAGAVFGLIGSGILADLLRLRAARQTSWPFTLAVVLLSAAGAVLLLLRTFSRQVGRGIRSSNRALPRGSVKQTERPRRPALSSTAFVASRDALIRLPVRKPSLSVQRLSGHPGCVTALALSSDGRQALSAGRDRAVVLWDVRTGYELLSFHGFGAEIRGVAFSPDGRLVVASGIDTWERRNNPAKGVVRLWDAQTGQELRRFEILGGLWAIDFLPDGQHVVFGGSEYVRLWEIEGPSPVAMIPLLKGWQMREEVRAIAVSPEGKLVLAGCHLNEAMRLVNLERGEEVREFLGHKRHFFSLRCAAVVSVAFSPDGMKAVSGSWDQTARVWNLLTAEQQTRFEGHRGWWGWRGVVGVAWLDERRILSVSENGLLCIWDAGSGEELAQFRHGAGVTCLACAPQAGVALTGGREGSIRVWAL